MNDDVKNPAPESSGTGYDGTTPLPAGFTDDEMIARFDRLRASAPELSRPAWSLVREAEAAGRASALAELREKVMSLPALEWTAQLMGQTIPVMTRLDSATVLRADVLSLLPTPEPSRD